MAAESNPNSNPHQSTNSSLLNDGDHLLHRVKNSSKHALDDGAQAQRDEELSRRVNEQYEKGRERIHELVQDSTTLPTTISSITVLNARNTRHEFLARIFNPLLSINQDQPYTLAETIEKVNDKANVLGRLDIYHQPISIYFDKPSQTDPSTTPTDLSVFLSVREKSRIVFSSGTWAGTNDGSVYGNLLLRNLFGGAESLNANVSYGTRTRSAYSLGFDTPLLSNPDLRLELGGLQSATDKSWASHEEQLRGAFTKLKYVTPTGLHRHELGYNGFWRQVTSLASAASPTVRADAGDSFKSSISHNWTYDRRDNALLPTKGFLFKTVSELAGVGPLKGDVSFGKFEAETFAAVPVPIPGLTHRGSESGISLTASLRGGLLCPLASGGELKPSRINDRFFLGGPTDVRGFRFAGLGPRDGAANDAVGGDVYAAGGLSLLLPMPRVSKERPLRIHAFINGGRLLSLPSISLSSSSSSSYAAPSSSSATESTSALDASYVTSSFSSSTASSSASSDDFAVGLHSSHHHHHHHQQQQQQQRSEHSSSTSSTATTTRTLQASSPSSFSHNNNSNSSSTRTTAATATFRETTDATARAVGSTLAQLADGLPSIAAGVGVVYALPVARFEVNFSLPISLRKGEEARKGLGVGVGISFL